METARSVVRNVMMAFLLITAIFSTFYAITGLLPSDIAPSVGEDKAAINGFDHILSFLSSGQSSPSAKALTYKVKSDQSKSVKTKLSSADDPIDLSQYPSHDVIATGYTAGTESTGKQPGDPSYGITYSGVKVRRAFFSTIAADTHIFPIGTILFIPGYGYGVVADTGSAIHGYKLDLYYNSVKDVYKEWGKRKVSVYIIKKGEGHLTEQTLNSLNNNDTVEVYQNLINS
ncbi:3D domain-containing protein [Pullulanibacillus sp. KACC 23026]|uniref:3D domain-containing protein n=1 Tax=Pullulanibacillus sp. KACC 23026 TaxID=3028315 RepID=UPI0023B0FBCE|nr:3D domain-containing protein [Pullulanibacillus sp. KACC 23026]WEG13790.1 3D domain-containing protein [Pullulanibacillus sp. KACC 23026]